MNGIKLLLSILLVMSCRFRNRYQFLHCIMETFGEHGHRKTMPPTLFCIIYFIAIYAAQRPNLVHRLWPIKTYRFLFLNFVKILSFNLLLSLLVHSIFVVYCKMLLFKRYHNNNNNNFRFNFFITLRLNQFALNDNRNDILS